MASNHLGHHTQADLLQAELPLLLYMQLLCCCNCSVATATDVVQQGHNHKGPELPVPARS
jgi:hypothetical protein